MGGSSKLCYKNTLEKNLLYTDLFHGMFVTQT